MPQRSTEADPSLPQTEMTSCEVLVDIEYAQVGLIVVLLSSSMAQTRCHWFLDQLGLCREANWRELSLLGGCVAMLCQKTPCCSGLANTGTDTLSLICLAVISARKTYFCADWFDRCDQHSAVAPEQIGTPHVKTCDAGNTFHLVLVFPCVLMCGGSTLCGEIRQAALDPQRGSLLPESHAEVMVKQQMYQQREQRQTAHSVPVMQCSEGWVFLPSAMYPGTE